jgi:WD40 repeat protein
LGWGMWRERDKAQVAQQFAEQEARLRAEVEIRRLLNQAQQWLRRPSKRRRPKTQAILCEIKEYRRRLEPGAVRDDLDLQARSLFAASLGVPEVKTVAKTNFPLPPIWGGHAVIHPDGQSVVLATPTGPVRWVLGGPSLRPEKLDPRARLPRLAYSPDGKYLVFAPAIGSLQVWDETVTRKLADLGPEKGSPVLGMGFDRAGKTLWTFRENGRVEAWSLPECQAKAGSAWTISTVGPLSAAAFGRAATRLAVGGHNGQVLLAQTDGKGQRSLQGAFTNISALAWSPDGQRVAAGCRLGDVLLWELASDRSIVIPFSDGEIHSLLFHPSGRWLMVGRGIGSHVFDAVTGQLVLDDLDKVCAFSADGERFGGVGRASVVIGAFHPPLGLRRLAGHQIRVSRLAWSRDNRHLISLDNRFEIRVWDLKMNEAIAVFRQNPTELFAGNAAVALSDDARLLAYASGGEFGAVALIQEVATGDILSTYKFGGGYERLACTGGDHFVLVREEIEANMATTHTVVSDLVPGRPAGEPRELRPSKPGDVWRFYDTGLSVDGRYYWWTGPRLTPHNRRVEVYDVKTGASLQCLNQPTQDENAAIGAMLSPDGRRLWYGDGRRVNLCDPARPGESTTVLLHPVALSADERWSVTQQDHPEPFLSNALFLGRGWLGEKAWLAFGDLGGSTFVGEPACFSPNGRYLAWGDDRGTIHIADLIHLEEQILAFEEAILAD